MQNCKKINLWELKELNKELYEKVIKEYIENNKDKCLNNITDDNNDMFYDDLKYNYLTFIDNKQFYYSLSFCQGDGLMFEGNFSIDFNNICKEKEECDKEFKENFNLECKTFKDLDLNFEYNLLNHNYIEDYIKRLIKKNKIYIHINIKHSGHYYHYNSKNLIINIEYDYSLSKNAIENISNAYPDLEDDVYKWINDWYIDTCKTLENIGYKSIYLFETMNDDEIFQEIKEYIENYSNENIYILLFENNEYEIIK